MNNKLYYILFKRCVEWGIRLFIAYIIAVFFSVFFSTFLTIFIVVLFSHGLFELLYSAVEEESYLTNIGRTLFDKLYDRDFKDYEYFIKEVILKNGTIKYYPMVKVTNHFPSYYIHRTYEYDSDLNRFYEYSISLRKCEPLKKEDAIFVIKKYIDQTEERHSISEGKKIKEINNIKISLN